MKNLQSNHNSIEFLEWRMFNGTASKFTLRFYQANWTVVNQIRKVKSIPCSAFASNICFEAGECCPNFSICLISKYSNQFIEHSAIRMNYGISFSANREKIRGFCSFGTKCMSYWPHMHISMPVDLICLLYLFRLVFLILLVHLFPSPSKEFPIIW